MVVGVDLLLGRGVDAIERARGEGPLDQVAVRGGCRLAGRGKLVTRKRERGGSANHFHHLRLPSGWNVMKA